MSQTIDYFLVPNSPWTYLGHERFAALAARAGAEVHFKPMDLAQVFPVSGGATAGAAGATASGLPVDGIEAV